MNRANYLSAYAYYKNFFDRISADMAFMVGEDPQCKKPNYKKYYHEGAFKKLYAGLTGCDEIISKAHELRNANPLSHSSADLIDSNNSSQDLMNTAKELDCLINQYAVDKQF